MNLPTDVSGQKLRKAPEKIFQRQKGSHMISAGVILTRASSCPITVESGLALFVKFSMKLL